MAIRSAALTHALALAKRGFCVFPLKPGEKRPVEGVSWPEVMTTDPDKIKAWFKDQPDMNYGVCPGADAAVIDLDVKGKVNGADALAEIEGEQDLDDWLFDAMSVSTPSGGRHIYVTGTGLVGNSHRFPAGIDIRGARGYVVGPGCAVAGKQYTPENDAPPKPAPAWVKERLQPPRQKAVDIDKPMFDLDLPAAIDRARGYLSRRGPAIEGFKGNEHTFVTAAQVKDLGVSMEQCLALMLEPGGWNDRCAPPWEPHEIADIVSHAYQYGKDRAGAKGGGLMDLYDSGDGEDGEDAPALPDQFADLRGITFRGAGIFARKHRREMVIPEWLPAHGMTAALAKRGGGKGLPLAEPVMTPWGWKAIGDMKEGDKVCRPDGGIAEVIGVYPQGVRPCYELTFSDGAKARCDDNHLWRVHVLDKGNGSYRYDKVLDIHRVIDLLQDHRVCVPTVTKLARRGRTVRPDLDYYLLGLLLGDGSFGPTATPSIKYCTDDEELRDYVMARGFKLHASKRKSSDGSDFYSLNLGYPRRCYPGDKKPESETYKSLKGLGLFGKGAADKAVPEALARANADQRLALLQGLMDTDGCVKRSSAEFCSASGVLASQVVDLARSLGARASISRSPSYLNGTRHKDRYRVLVQPGNKFNPFRLKRKAEAIERYQHKHLWRRIVSIKPIEAQESVCIKIDSIDGLFVTRDYVVTHNTAIMLDMALRICSDMEWFGQPVAPGWAAVYLCGEDDVGAEEQVRAWCSVNEMEAPPERFIFLAGIVDLLSAGETEKWTKYLLSEVLDGQRAVVFVDTWQRATGRGGQNKDEDMQLAVHHAEAMARSLRGPSVVAFHPPKHDDRAVMGSSVIENATTAIWRISDQATARRLEVERIKGKGVGNYVTFTLKEVGLGQNDDFGRERTGVVVEKIGGTEYVLDPEVLEQRQQIYAELIRDLDLERKSADPKSKHLSIRAVATRIVELFEEAKSPDGGKRQRAEAIVSRLRDAGTVSFSQRTLEDHIRQLLGNDPRGYDFGDGYVLRTLRDGKALRFAIERSGV